MPHKKTCSGSPQKFMLFRLPQLIRKIEFQLLPKRPAGTSKRLLLALRPELAGAGRLQREPGGRVGALRRRLVPLPAAHVSGAVPATKMAVRDWSITGSESSNQLTRWACTPKRFHQVINALRECSPPFPLLTSVAQ